MSTAPRGCLVVDKTSIRASVCRAPCSKQAACLHRNVSATQVQSACGLVKGTGGRRVGAGPEG